MPGLRRSFYAQIGLYKSHTLLIERALDIRFLELGVLGFVNNGYPLLRYCILLVDKSKIKEFLDAGWIFEWVISQIVDIVPNVVAKFGEGFCLPVR